jgi:hypothetical protein
MEVGVPPFFVGPAGEIEMATQLRALRVLGLHPVRPSAEDFDEAVETLWGSELSGTKLKAARRNVEEHFRGLFLIEIEVQPPDSEFDWADLTQPIDAQPRSNWQVPYDEQLVDPEAGRWAFFLHCVDLTRPMSTPLGDRHLPEPTPVPDHLEMIKYDLP